MDRMLPSASCGGINGASSYSSADLDDPSVGWRLERSRLSCPPSRRTTSDSSGWDSSRWALKNSSRADSLVENSSLIWKRRATMRLDSRKWAGWACSPQSLPKRLETLELGPKN